MLHSSNTSDLGCRNVTLGPIDISVALKTRPPDEVTVQTFFTRPNRRMGGGTQEGPGEGAMAASYTTAWVVVEAAALVSAAVLYGGAPRRVYERGDGLARLSVPGRLRVAVAGELSAIGPTTTLNERRSVRGCAHS